MKKVRKTREQKYSSRTSEQTRSKNGVKKYENKHFEEITYMHGNGRGKFESANILQNQKTPKRLFYVSHTNVTSLARREKEIADFLAQKIVCSKCGEVIGDIAASINDKKTGEPIHFECAMNEVSKMERIGENEKICYIGQGRFAVVYFDNPRDQRKFTIKKVINWEDSGQRKPWRQRMSELYSQIE